MCIPTLHYDKPTYQQDVQKLLATLRAGGLTAGGDESLDVPSIVADILAEVRKRGDAAAAELTSRFDRARIRPETLRVEAETIAAARAQADDAFMDLIAEAAENIRQFQQSILHTDPAPLVRGGRQLSVRYTPVDRVGVYTPGGKAMYPSTVLMTVVPALVAGVRQVVLVSPPTGGEINPMVLALAAELGLEEVYRLGGAVAVGALAYGTETIRPVQKIVGPGNAFVAEAKRQVLGTVGIDSIAGPSEVLIVADHTARADWVAADLLAQAEHDPGSAILITDSDELAGQVAQQLSGQLNSLERASAIRAALAAYSAIVVVASLDDAYEMANEIATEHLQIIVSDEQAALERITNAGAIFVGPHTPVPLGDYFAGPSHVLPTGGTARFFGPLSCNDFLKASSILHYDAESLAADADRVIDFATREGLTAHARAVQIRKQ
ncbi:MAG: histidinol dehydrogenase [Planctomycetota bacterium]